MTTHRSLFSLLPTEILENEIMTRVDVLSRYMLRNALLPHCYPLRSLWHGESVALLAQIPIGSPYIDYSLYRYLAERGIVNETDLIDPAIVLDRVDVMKMLVNNDVDLSVYRDCKISNAIIYESINILRWLVSSHDYEIDYCLLSDAFSIPRLRDDIFEFLIAPTTKQCDLSHKEIQLLYCDAAFGANLRALDWLAKEAAIDEKYIPRVVNDALKYNSFSVLLWLNNHNYLERIGPDDLTFTYAITEIDLLEWIDEKIGINDDIIPKIVVNAAQYAEGDPVFVWAADRIDMGRSVEYAVNEQYSNDVIDELRDRMRSLGVIA